MKKQIYILALALLFSSKAWALNLIRDTEIEKTVTGYVQQIFKATNLPPENAEIVLIFLIFSNKLYHCPLFF